MKWRLASIGLAVGALILPPQGAIAGATVSVSTSSQVARSHGNLGVGKGSVYGVGVSVQTGTPQVIRHWVLPAQARFAQESRILRCERDINGPGGLQYRLFYAGSDRFGCTIPLFYAIVPY